MGEVLNYFMHLDDHLKAAITQFGPWTYGILFLIVFCETGLVFMPFLPGDSLLFTAGVIARQDAGLSFWITYLTFIVAALCGDNLNYFIGRYFGHKLFNKPKSKVFKKENLIKTHAFVEEHGPKAIVIGRFVPIVRTFVPFVSGMGEMEYHKFLRWSILGALIWVTVCVGGGFAFGSIPLVQENFSTVIYLLIGFTLIPIIVEAYRHRVKMKQGISVTRSTDPASEPGE